MTNVISGLDALSFLEDKQETSSNSFTSLKSGDSRKVKVIGFPDFNAVASYGIFKQTNTFIPENPSKLSDNGYPIADLTPWDLAWRYHKDLSKEFGDHHSTEASKYRVKIRYAIGFYDLDEKEFIVIDFTLNQAKKIIGAIVKQNEAGRLGKRAFELTKTGTGTSTEVGLDVELLDDLTPEQAKAFEEAPAEFDKSLFDGLYYVMNEEQQIESLTQAGFDVSLIGLTPKQGGNTAEESPFVAAEDPTQNF